MQDKEKETQLKGYECAYCVDALRKANAILCDLKRIGVVEKLSAESIVVLARGAQMEVGCSLPLLRPRRERCPRCSPAWAQSPAPPG